MDVELIDDDLGRKRLSDFRGKKLVLNIFPSVNTGVCSASVRAFNQRAVSLDNTEVLCISRDLPFAQKAFCAAEGIDRVHMLSDYATHELGIGLGVEMIDGNFYKLLARSVITVNEEGTVLYTELVPEIGQEPDYDAAIASIS
jgi:thiol peroxidase